MSFACAIFIYSFSFVEKEEILVAVVILGWNGKRFLEQFLPSVVQYSNLKNTEVVYADNASTDDSVAFVREKYPTVRVVQNSENKGFAGGYNEALKQVRAKYYVLLNQDVEVTENWLLPVIDFLETNENYAAAQPKILAYHDKNSFEYAGASGGYVDYLGYAFCRGRIFETVEKNEQQYEDVVPVFWATGACLFVRSDVYWQTGGLDEDFFAHQEEIDLCWRIQSFGHQIAVVPQAHVYHVGGGSLPQGSPRKTYLNFRNSLFLLTKNLPWSRLWWTLPFRLMLDGIAILQSVVKNKNWKDAMPILRAHNDFIKQLFYTLKKRKHTKHSVPKTLYKKSIVWQYFLLGKKRFSDLNGNGVKK